MSCNRGQPPQEGQQPTDKRRNHCPCHLPNQTETYSSVGHHNQPLVNCDDDLEVRLVDIVAHEDAHVNSHVDYEQNHPLVVSSALKTQPLLHSESSQGTDFSLDTGSSIHACLDPPSSSSDLGLGLGLPACTSREVMSDMHGYYQPHVQFQPRMQCQFTSPMGRRRKICKAPRTSRAATPKLEPVADGNIAIATYMIEENLDNPDLGVLGLSLGSSASARAIHVALGSSLGLGSSSGPDPSLSANTTSSQYQANTGRRCLRRRAG